MRSLNLRLLAAFALFAVPAASAAGQRAPVAPRPPARQAPAPALPAYTNVEYHFSFTPPPGWVQKLNKDAVCLFMEPAATSVAAPLYHETNKEFLARMRRKMHEGSEGARFRANISVAVVRGAPVRSLAEYVAESRALVAKRKAYRILGEKPFTLGGVAAVERTVRVTLPEGATTRNREVICLRNGTLLTIALASAPDDFARNSAEFDRTLASFRWTK